MGDRASRASPSLSARTGFMTRVLYIEGSPNKDYSASIDVCNAFLDAYRHASRSRDTDARHLESGDTRIRRSRAGREICGTERQRVDAGSGGGMATDRAARGAVPRSGQAPVRRAAVEFQYSVQTQAPDRRDLAEGRAVHVRRHRFCRQAGREKGGGCLRARAGYQSPGPFTPAAEFDLQRPYMETSSSWA